MGNIAAFKEGGGQLIAENKASVHPLASPIIRGELSVLPKSVHAL